MKIKSLIIVFTGCLLLIPYLLHADIPTAQFLLVGQGPRAEAMGQSVVSNCFDHTSLYWNPAASVFLDRPELGLNNTELPADIKNNFLAFIYPLKKFAFGLRLISHKAEVVNYDNSGNLLGGKDTEDDTNFNFVTGYKFSDSFSLGLGAGNTEMSLSGKKASTGNLNIGTIYKKERISFGFSFANLGGKMKFTDASNGEEQPMLLRAGLSYSFLQNKNLLIATSYEKVIQDSKAGGFSVGGEFLSFKYLTLRTGVKMQNDKYTKPSFGFGLHYKMFFLDYAFTMFAAGDLKNTEVHRLGLSVKFGKEKEEAPSEIKKLEAPVAPVEKPARIPGKIINLAVAELVGKNVSQADASIVSDFLRTELVNTGVFNVLERANMDKILSEAGFQMAGCTTAECAVQIGKLLNVQQMIVGSLSKLMDTYYITVNLVEVETGRIIASYDQEATSAKELRAACKTLAQKIAQ